MSRRPPLVCFDGVMDAARSGGWRVFTSTLRALARLDGVRLAAILPADRATELADIADRCEIVPVRVSPTQPLRSIAWRALRLPGLVTRLAADVVHVPAHNLLVARKVRPTVVTIHDITELHLKGHYDPLRMLYRRYVVPRNARIADRITTVSHWTCDDIVRTLDVPAERVVVVPNGVDPSFRPVPPGEAAALVRAATGLQPPYVLYVGRIHMPNKNLARLVEAFAAARDRLPAGTVLALAGTGGSADEVRSAVRRANVEPAVRWLGYVPDSVLPALYSAAAAFCYPSLREGFGLPVLEAMSCGTPAITSDTSALGEIARGAALLVDPYATPLLAEALVRITTDEALRARLGPAGRRRAGAYTWDEAAKRLTAVYSELADAAT